MQWEVFLPEQYKVRDFGGDALAVNLLPPSFHVTSEGLDLLALYSPGVIGGYSNSNGNSLSTVATAPSPLLPGQLGGVVTDSQGAVVSGAQVRVTSSTTGIQKMATTDSSGRWFVANMPPGQVKVEIASPGFKTALGKYDRDATTPLDTNIRLTVAEASATVEVTAEAPMIEGLNPGGGSRNDRGKKKQLDQQVNGPSSNVMNLQRRVAGVLPVRVDVPRAGNSFRFVRPLVLDEETKVTFNYKNK